ncbi:MAG TPA: ParM/StbA family protein [Firmicutes bacterium]|nr:ParM/StbA family protein [Bacillota bacterium]
MAKRVGLDVGYGFVKATDGAKGFSFPSVIGQGHEKPVFSTRMEKRPLIEDLKVSIGGDSYFVGRAAMRHAKYVQRDLSYTRAADGMFQVLVFSALSLFADGQQNEFKVVTGLPPERMHLMQDVEKRMQQRVTVTLHEGKRSKDIDIWVSDVEVVPQPLGTYWSYVLNSQGIAKGDLSGRVGIIDIGFRTSDLALIEDGDYVPEKSKTIPVASSTAYSHITEGLVTKYGFEAEGYILDEAVITKKINVSGESLDITDIVKSAFQKLASAVLIEMNSFWRLQDLDLMILSGGGGKGIYEFLLPAIPRLRMSEQPVTANSIGFLSWANRKWGGTFEEDGDDAGAF